MILYLSSQERTNLLDFLMEEENAPPVKKMTGRFMLKQVVIYDMRNFSHCREVILDRAAFVDEDEIFAEAVGEFLTMYSARITVICEGLQEGSVLFRKLLDAGVKNLVTAEEIEKIRDEIRVSLSRRGMPGFAAGGERYCFSAENVQIAVAGAQERIGTTTIALGLATWLGSAGAEVAYIERNERKVLSSLKDAYEMEEEVKGEGYWLEGVWYGEQMPEQGYQFLIEDYGTGEADIQADILLLICGTKPYEIRRTMQFLQRFEKREAYVLCPFVDRGLWNTYVEALETDYHRVFFVEYQPDCMDGGPNAKMFKTIVRKYMAGA